MQSQHQPASCCASATRDYVRSIPVVLQVVTPLALDVTYDPKESRGDVPVPSPTFLEPRLYTLRASCRRAAPAHVFLLGLATDPSEEMTARGAERIARLLNDQGIVITITRSWDGCDAPFAHTTLTDRLEDGGALSIEAVSYHCHCGTPFSEACWRVVFSAAEKVAAVCKEIRGAKAKYELF